MRFLEMMEQWTTRAPEVAGVDHQTPPGWAKAAPQDADLAWRPAPDPRDGSLTQDPDFSVHSSAGPVAWQLFHNSSASGSDSPWGFGRRASFPLKLTSDGTTVTVMHEDGSDRRYQLITGSWVPQGTPTGDSLVKNGDNTWTETRGETGYAFQFPAGNVASLSYWATPHGLRVTCAYDASKRLSTLTEPTGQKVTVTYNAQSRVQAVQDWAGRINTLAYSGAGDLIQVQGPTGCLTQYGHDGSHRITSILDPEGYATTYSYDFAGRVLTRSVAGNLGRYTYQATGTILTMGYTDPLGNTWTHTSSAGSPTGQIDPKGGRETYTYVNSRPSAFTDALGMRTSYSFDAKGFLTGSQDALGYRTTYTRDSTTNQVKTVKDALGFVTTHTWGMGTTGWQLQAITDAVGAITTFTYTSHGFPHVAIDAVGARTTYTWTGMGLLESQHDPCDCRWTYSYDLAGNRIEELTPRNARL